MPACNSGWSRKRSGRPTWWSESAGWCGGSLKSVTGWKQHLDQSALRRRQRRLSLYATISDSEYQRVCVRGVAVRHSQEPVPKVLGCRDTLRVGLQTSKSRGGLRVVPPDVHTDIWRAEPKRSFEGFTRLVHRPWCRPRDRSVVTSLHCMND